MAESEKLKVAFVNPPFLPNYSRGQRSPAVTRSGTLYFPLWLSYAAAHAKRLGYSGFLLDCPADNLDSGRMLEALDKFSPDLVVVETATPSIANDMQMARTIKQKCAARRVFACGTHVSALPQQSLELATEIDGIVVGEFEIPVENILRALADKRDLKNLEGVFLNGDTPKPRTTYFSDLDARPFVSEIYKEFLPISRYFNPNAHHPMVAIVTGRGCPHSCSFCVFPQTLTGKGYRKRSVDSIIQEFKWIAENLPSVKGVFIEDDTFTADRERVREFCRQLQNLDLPLTWTANVRADLDRETIEIMGKANLRAVCVGFESGSQDLLNAIGKGNTLERMEKFAQDTSEAGVKVHGCFIVGLPGETRLTLQQTLQFALRLPLDSAQFYPLMVYPGTRAYEWAVDNGLLAVKDFRSYLSSEGLHECVVRTPQFSSRQLVKFCNHARRRFYLRKSYLWSLGLRVLSDSEERHRVIRSAKTFLKHLLGDR